MQKQWTETYFGDIVLISLFKVKYVWFVSKHKEIFKLRGTLSLIIILVYCQRQNYDWRRCEMQEMELEWNKNITNRRKTGKI
jgi:hypothetical protein